MPDAMIVVGSVTLCLLGLLVKFAWHLFKKVLVISPLENVPGPPPTASWILGQQT